MSMRTGHRRRRGGWAPSALLIHLLVVALLLAACSQPSEEPAADGGQDPEPAADGGQDSEPAAEAPASIKIGGFFTLSGAITAPEGLWGSEIAVETVNDNGGIDGVPLELVVRDHQCQAEQMGPAMGGAVQQDIVAGLVACSGPALAGAPIAAEEEVLLFNIGGSALELAGASDYLFNALVLGDQTVLAGLNYLANDAEVETLSVIYANDAVGNSLNGMISEEADRFDIEVLDSFAYAPETSDFSGVLERVEQGQPDAVYIASLGSATGQIRRQAVERGYDPPMLSYAGVYGEIADIAGPALEGTLWTSPELDLETDVGQEYLEKFEAAHPDSSSGYVDVTPHDAILIIAEAFRAAAEEGGEWWTGPRLRQAVLEQRRFEGLVGGTYEFTDIGTVVRPVEVYRWTDGDAEAVARYSVSDLVELRQ